VPTAKFNLLLHLREADWLDRRRVRAYAALLALASLVVLANSFHKAMGSGGTDFLAFWGAGHVAAAGEPPAAYDLAVQERVQTGTGSSVWFAFVNPPPFLFFAAPFGVLPFPLAWIAWVAVTFALWAVTAIRAFPRMWIVVLVFPGALLAAGHAQTGLLTGALLVGGVSLVDRRPLLAGALLGALIIKPHLALLVPVWLAAGGRWRAFLAAGASAAGLLVLSLAVFGGETLGAYTAAWAMSAAILDGAGPDFYLRMVSFYAQACLLLPRIPALAIHGGLAAFAGAFVVSGSRRFRQDGLASGALMLCATALASPYLFNYDLPFLIVPVLWLVQQGLCEGFRQFEKLALVGVYAAPFATRAAALPMGINLMPIASSVLLWLVWSRIYASGEATSVPKRHVRDKTGTRRRTVH